MYFFFFFFFYVLLLFFSSSNFPHKNPVLLTPADLWYLSGFPRYRQGRFLRRTEDEDKERRGKEELSILVVGCYYYTKFRTKTNVDCKQQILTIKLNPTTRVTYISVLQYSPLVKFMIHNSEDVCKTWWRLISLNSFCFFLSKPAQIDCQPVKSFWITFKTFRILWESYQSFWHNIN